jgi:cysteine desulfurase
MAFYLAIMGSISTSHSPINEIKYSPIEKKEILAIVDGLDQSIKRHEFVLGLDGLIQDSSNDDYLTIFQIRNGETGIDQEVVPAGNLIIDATSALPGDLVRLGIANRPWRAIILDATSWGGPRGVYYLAINPAYPWRNPFPTLDTSMAIFGANYGLTLMATLALEEFMTWDLKAITLANETIRERVTSIPDVDLAGTVTRDRLSLSFLYLQSEELQRELWSEGFLVDSGSACSSSALEPSHVLTRMGLLSHGNVRLRFRPENIGSAESLAETLIRQVSRLRK